MTTHFAVTGPEYLLDEVQVCPALSEVTCEGYVVDDQGRRHLIVQVGTVRLHLGPDIATVKRTLQVVAAAMKSRPVPPPSEQLTDAVTWLLLTFHGTSGFDPLERAATE